MYRVLALQNETLNCPVELEPDTLAENNETQFLGDLEVVDPEILSDGCSRWCLQQQWSIKLIISGGPAVTDAQALRVIILKTTQDYARTTREDFCNV